MHKVPSKQTAFDRAAFNQSHDKRPAVSSQICQGLLQAQCLRKYRIRQGLPRAAASGPPADCYTRKGLQQALTKASKLHSTGPPSVSCIVKTSGGQPNLLRPPANATFNFWTSFSNACYKQLRWIRLPSDSCVHKASSVWSSRQDLLQAAALYRPSAGSCISNHPTGTRPPPTLLGGAACSQLHLKHTSGTSRPRPSRHSICARACSMTYSRPSALRYPGSNTQDPHQTGR
jgi:hypothetical protein